VPERQWAVLAMGGDFYEGPRWHEGAWWVSDFYQHRVSSFSLAGVESLRLEIEDQPSGLGWLPDGSLVVSSMSRRHLLRIKDGRVETHADLSALCGGHLNDLVVDQYGHVFVGDFGYDIMAGDPPVPTSLKRVDLDGTVVVAAHDLYFPNGSAITADGRTLIVCETLGNRCAAFDLASDGSLSRRREWASFGPLPSGDTMSQLESALVLTPDGCSLDAEGHLWCADSIGHRVVRLAPGGAIVESLSVPNGLNAFACMLGGQSGSTLLVCTAPDYFADRRAGTGEGVLHTVEVDVPHSGRP
jgi:sugar lactone lactonase YvrE